MRYNAYKYRLYPTKEQVVLLEKTFGCCRYVYNRALETKTAIYQAEKKGISIFQLINQMADWKDAEETKWLREVNSQALQTSLRNLDAAFTKFFKKEADYPVFKKKHNGQSFTNPQSTKVSFDENRVYLPKFKKGIRAVFHRKFEGKIKSSTVSKTKTGKYFISVLVEEDITNPQPPEPQEDKCLGIDLGTIDFAVTSDGKKISNPKFLKWKLRKLRRLQRAFDRKKKGSKNREKNRKKVAIVHEKIANTRRDFLHKVSRQFVDNQDYTSIAIENLKVKEMNHDSYYAQSNQDAGFYMFRTFLSYKCERVGKSLLIIGQFEPSTKLCTCGRINHSLTTDDRAWTCVACGTTHDRDILAANNIKRFAFRKQNTNFIGKDYPESTPTETGAELVAEVGSPRIYSGE